MPIYRDPFSKGVLVIQFSVKFPVRINPTKVAVLEQCLPSRQEEIIPDESEHVNMVDYEPRAQLSHTNHEAYDGDERPHPGIQCATH